MKKKVTVYQLSLVGDKIALVSNEQFLHGSEEELKAMSDAEINDNICEDLLPSLEIMLYQEHVILLFNLSDEMIIRLENQINYINSIAQ